MLKTLNDRNFQEEIKKTGNLILVEVGALWCGTCSIMEPILNQLAVEYEGRIMVGRVDIDTGKKIATEYGIKELPMYLFFKNGHMIDHIVGSVSKFKLVAKINYSLNHFN